jgi:soluble lytic murein transglycosylase-like protein
MIGAFVLAALAAQTTASPTAGNLTSYVQEAALRTNVPEQVIWAVIRAESRGNATAVSPKGAMGVMQLMPNTWQSLRKQLNLGADAFDPHDNIMAGTYYLRQLYDQYGWQGAFAAYNAGPSRYELYRDHGKTLPGETQAYVVSINTKLGTSAGPITDATPKPRATPWTEAGLFVADTGADGPMASSSPAGPFVSLSATGAATSE